MRIQESSIDLATTHQTITSEIEGSRLVAWSGDGPAQPPPSTRLPTDALEISPEARTLLPMPTEVDLGAPSEGLDDFEMRLLGLILEAFTGVSWDVLTPNDLADAFELDFTMDMRQLRAQRNAPVSRDDRPRDGWGVQVDLYRAYRETEKMSFQAEGIVKTADGREIQIDVELRMAREWAEEHSLSLQVEGGGGDQMVDPLVINFAGNAAELTSDTFTFDLDVDGQADQIAMLAPGSAYLAHDHNGD
ncbi:MAG: hypothetical protein QF464_15515, partial [Myxococcota bacterium]|nr:hypothetical protein [Myxococcota bacterium]